MLPVSQAVQANKATSARSAKESGANPEQGFGALLAQGLARPGEAGAKTPDTANAGAAANARQLASNDSHPATSSALTRPPGGPVTGGPAATDDAKTDAPRDAATTPQNGASPSASDSQHKTARGAQHGDGLTDPAAAGMPGSPQGLINVSLATPLPAPATSGRDALVGRSGGLAARSGPLPGTGLSATAAATPADVQTTAESGRSLAGRRFQSDGPAGEFGQMLATAEGAGSAAAGTDGASGNGDFTMAGVTLGQAGAAPPGGAQGGGTQAAGALGAGLSALLERNAQQFSNSPAGSLSSGLIAASPSTHGTGGASLTSVSADSAQMYSQMSQNLAMTPAIDPGVAPGGTVSLPLTPTVGDERWASALGQQALFMVGKHLSSAQLTLNPPNLGPIQVTLDMRHDQASATFVTPHDAVRQAIEASLPHLRDLFSAAGLHLEQAQVQASAGNLSGGAAGQQFNQSGDANPRFVSSASTAGVTVAGISAGPAAGSPLPILRARGLLDTFA